MDRSISESIQRHGTRFAYWIDCSTTTVNKSQEHTLLTIVTFKGFPQQEVLLTSHDRKLRSASSSILHGSSLSCCHLWTRSVAVKSSYYFNARTEPIRQQQFKGNRICREISTRSEYQREHNNNYPIHSYGRWQKKK